MKIKNLIPFAAILGFTAACVAATTPVVHPVSVAVMPAIAAVSIPTVTEAVQPTSTNAVNTPTVVENTPTAVSVPTAFTPVAGWTISKFSTNDVVVVMHLQMIDVAMGWAIATDKTNGDDHILRTDDGARTWKDVTPPDPVYPKASRKNSAAVKRVTIERTGPHTLWAAYSYIDDSSPKNKVFVWVTRDDGSTWATGDPIAVDSAIFQPISISRGNMLVKTSAELDKNSVVVYNADGVSWHKMPSEALSGCQKTGMLFVDDKTGWISATCPSPNGSYLYQTTDGGNTWGSYNLPSPTNVKDVFASGKCSTILSSPYLAEGLTVTLRCKYEDTRTAMSWLYTTQDNGKTWEESVLPTSYGNLYQLDKNLGWWIGNDSAFDTAVHVLFNTQDGGKTWTQVKRLSWGGELSFVDDKTGWAVAYRDQTYAPVQTLNSGAAWFILTPVLVK